MISLYAEQSPRVEPPIASVWSFSGWCMSLRSSNIESLLLLNIEARGAEGIIYEEVKNTGGISWQELMH